MNFQVATVYLVVVGDDKFGKAKVLVLDRFDRSLKRAGNEIEAAEGLILKTLKILVV
jgi:hypothetical protein